MNQLGSDVLRILVVVDDLVSYQVLASALRRLGHLNVQRAEETMLPRASYPKLAEHIKLHQSMIEQTRGILLRIEALESGVEKEVFQFLKEWWLAHIQTANRDYGDYLLATSPSR